MIYSTILDSFSRLGVLAGRTFSIRGLPAVAALTVVLALVTGAMPGTVGTALAQDKTPPPSVPALLPPGPPEALRAELLLRDTKGRRGGHPRGELTISL